MKVEQLSPSVDTSSRPAVALSCEGLALHKLKLILRRYQSFRFRLPLSKSFQHRLRPRQRAVHRSNPDLGTKEYDLCPEYRQLYARTAYRDRPPARSLREYSLYDRTESRSRSPALGRSSCRPSWLSKQSW